MPKKKSKAAFNSSYLLFLGWILLLLFFLSLLYILFLVCHPLVMVMFF